MKMPVNTYAQILQESGRRQSNLLSKPLTKYQLYDEDCGVPPSAMTTWDVTFNHIKGVNAASCKLLQIMSLHDFQGIPRRLVDCAKVRSHLELPDDIDFEDALQPLVSFSPVSIGLENEYISYRLHRLVSLWTRMSLIVTHELVPFTLDLVLENSSKPCATNLQPCETYMPLATAILSYMTASEQLGSKLESTKIDLQYPIGVFYRQAWRLDQARELHRACYEFYLENYGPGNEKVYHTSQCPVLEMVTNAQGLYAVDT